MGIKVNVFLRIIKLKKIILRKILLYSILKLGLKLKQNQKALIKFMNNSLFGKTCVKSLIYIEEKKSTDEFEILKSVSQPKS